MVTISVGKITDNDDIRKIRRETWFDTYPNPELGITVEDLESEFSETPKQAIENRKQAEKWFNDPVNRYLVARDNGKIVGFFIGRKNPDYNRIMAIYVLPSHQRKGIGAVLMDQGMEWLGNDKDVLVNVASYNLKAQDFYRKFGFELTGKDVTDRHNPLPSGKVIPEVEMKKSAKPHQP